MSGLKLGPVALFLGGPGVYACPGLGPKNQKFAPSLCDAQTAYAGDYLRTRLARKWRKNWSKGRKSWWIMWAPWNLWAGISYFLGGGGATIFLLKFDRSEVLSQSFVSICVISWTFQFWFLGDLLTRVKFMTWLSGFDRRFHAHFFWGAREISFSPFIFESQNQAFFSAERRMFLWA